MTMNKTPQQTSGSAPTPDPNLPSWQGGSQGSGTVQNVFDAPATKQFGGQLLSDARKVYMQGPKVFNQSLYAGLSDTTRDALGGMLDMDTSGYDDAMSGAMDYYGGLARGEGMGLDDPNFARMRQGMIDDTVSNVSSAFGSMGRNFGGSHVGTMTDRIGDTLSELDYGRLQDDYARRDAATAALPGLLQGRMMPGQLRYGIGQIFDQDAQAALTGANDLFRRQNDAGFTHVANNVNLLTGGGGKDGPLTPDAPWWQTLLGTGLNFAGSLLGGGN